MLSRPLKKAKLSGSTCALKIFQFGGDILPFFTVSNDQLQRKNSFCSYKSSPQHNPQYNSVSFVKALLAGDAFYE